MQLKLRTLILLTWNLSTVCWILSLIVFFLFNFVAGKSMPCKLSVKSQMSYGLWLFSSICMSPHWCVNYKVSFRFYHIFSLCKLLSNLNLCNYETTLHHLDSCAIHCWLVFPSRSFIFFLSSKYTANFILFFAGTWAKITWPAPCLHPLAI